jgi:hypothetical protein
MTMFNCWQPGEPGRHQYFQSYRGQGMYNTYYFDNDSVIVFIAGTTSTYRSRDV